MRTSVEAPSSAQTAAGGQGVLASSPLLLLVFGFVFLILLQAWFVRRIAMLTARHKECQDACRKLAAEVAQLNEEVSNLDRASESNAVSIAGLERETQEIQERIDAFLAEHAEAVQPPPAGTPTRAAPAAREPAATHDVDGGATDPSAVAHEDR